MSMLSPTAPRCEQCGNQERRDIELLIKPGSPPPRPFPAHLYGARCLKCGFSEIPPLSDAVKDR
jgi:predicted Zn-ribbon and HTH transcriptional regulator